MDSADRPPLDAGFLRELLVGPTGPLARLEIVERSESTNTDLAAAVAADPGAWPAPALLVAEHQVAGRGRAGRAWETPARAALTCSLLVRPQLPRESMSWLPLLAGLAAVTALRSTVGLQAVAKWPNDVLLDEAGPPLEGWGTARKVAGILTELLPDGGAIVGIGVNVSQTAEELPVESATSLALAGAATTDRLVILTALGEAYASVLGRWAAADGDVESSGLGEEIAAVSATVGSDVSVSLLDGSVLYGEAIGHAPDGALLVRDAQGRTQTVRSGDVHHLRVG
ncbi:biotin--[acetyl-CoA-carboxylase] ligase [Sanguibacter antarcticus]|uniref:BirA family biotin operon repressor/biotin-[acetyl-CoA-carboxylase] ligase n=1 Tax=Sanguibacter antarcticus TaxID=372484 RepID=A0A2A9E693_9MICO|nr:biotin--[acetyl-CoA-carboxylase] ligase [Sanguibacter antarcticus]PFG33700.1 BirA family biotin operon repressor/biotin-[acetyl-CoA-carboxylase] ligase [Sanguibacter antarcticus]